MQGSTPCPAPSPNIPEYGDVMRYVALGISHDLFPDQCKIEKQRLAEPKEFFDSVVLSLMNMEDRNFLEDHHVDTGIEIGIPTAMHMPTLEPGDELLVIASETSGVYRYTVYSVGSI
jgi:hypothetical protein